MSLADTVSGATRIYGIVGDPIVQVQSPGVVTAEFRRRGMDAVLIPLHVPAAAFEDTIPRLKAVANLGGLVMTVPFKGQAMDHADEIGPEGLAGEGINAMVRRADGTWAGEMFDGLGCLAALAGAGHSPEGRSVLLVGAGGAGSAIGLAVARRGPARLRIAEIDAGKAEALAARIAGVAPHVAVETGPPDPGGFDMVLNATPLGMASRPESPLSAPVTPGSVVFDAVPSPAETRMMAEARAAGAQAIGGIEMIKGQVGLIVDFFQRHAVQNERK